MLVSVAVAEDCETVQPSSPTEIPRKVALLRWRLMMLQHATVTGQAVDGHCVDSESVQNGVKGRPAEMQRVQNEIQSLERCLSQASAPSQK
jgi:hypothetical protein